jgi:hypothetical protein
MRHFSNVVYEIEMLLHLRNKQNLGLCSKPFSYRYQ